MSVLHWQVWDSSMTSVWSLFRTHTTHCNRSTKTNLPIRHSLSIKCYAAFTLTTIRPRLVSWSSSWTNRDYRIQSYQIASHLDINRDNRANHGKIFGCQKFCHDYHDWRDYRDHRIRSYDIVTNRNKSYLILFLNRGDRDRPKHRDLLR